MGEERATPRGLGVAHAAGHDGRGQPAHGTAAGVEQAGLAREPLPVADHAHDVPRAARSPPAVMTCASQVWP